MPASAKLIAREEDPMRLKKITGFRYQLIQSCGRFFVPATNVFAEIAEN